MRYFSHGDNQLNVQVQQVLLLYNHCMSIYHCYTFPAFHSKRNTLSNPIVWNPSNSEFMIYTYIHGIHFMNGYVLNVTLFILKDTPSS